MIIAKIGIRTVNHTQAGRARRRFVAPYGGGRLCRATQGAGVRKRLPRGGVMPNAGPMNRYSEASGSARWRDGPAEPSRFRDDAGQSVSHCRPVQQPSFTTATSLNTRLAILWALLCVTALTACNGGTKYGFDPEPYPPVAEVFFSEVGQSPTVEVSCFDLISLMCEVEWEGNDTWDDAIVYRNTVDDFATATEISRGWGMLSYFLDRSVEAGTRYYYWVVFEDEGERSPVSESASACPVMFSGGPRSCADPAGPVAQTGDNNPGPEAAASTFPRSSSRKHYQSVNQALLATEVAQAPVYHDGKYLFVGIDQGADTLAEMASAGSSSSSSSETVVTPTGTYQTSVTRSVETTVGKRAGWSVRHGRFEQTQGRGGAREVLADYLKQSAQIERISDGTPLVMRFTQPPVVRFGGTAATAADADRLMRAVQLVNAALPLEWRMQMPSGTPSSALTPQEKSNSVYVEFVPTDAYRRPGSLGYASVEWYQDGSIHQANIEIDKAYRASGERGAVTVLAHELLHALGVGHVSPELRTIMSPHLDTTAEDMPVSLLYPIDREALRAMYGRMAAGSDITNFGPWANSSTHLIGDNDHAAFGVALRNGYAEPWAYGHIPGSDLADNAALVGRATWRGILLGFTPSSKPVAGNSRLGINLNDLTGRADFTSLESWPVGSAPGNAGTGAVWGDGNLGYSVVVNGNTFRQTGGDEGIVTGAFFGASHEGMGGTLERTDLTAGFGGSRGQSASPPAQISPGRGDADAAQANPVTSAEIKTHLGALIRSSDTVTDGNSIDGGRFHFRPNPRPTPANLEWSDLKESDLDYQRLNTRRGVSLAQGERQSMVGRTRFSGIGYGGWLDHSFFFVAGSTIEDTDPLAPSLSTFQHAYSIGDRTGRNPIVGSATWSGVVVGYSGDGKTIGGDAGLTADFASSNIDVAFTNLVEQGGTTRRSNMNWADVPMRSGSFEASGLSGHFYGPNHEEAGGIFNRNEITGAFGALRE